RPCPAQYYVWPMLTAEEGAEVDRELQSAARRLSERHRASMDYLPESHLIAWYREYERSYIDTARRPFYLASLSVFLCVRPTDDEPGRGLFYVEHHPIDPADSFFLTGRLPDPPETMLF